MKTEYSYDGFGNPTSIIQETGLAGGEGAEAWT